MLHITDMICTECDTEWPVDRFCQDGPNPTVCFRCRVQTVNLGYGGYRQQFHDGTIAERQRRQIAEARSNGLDPIPAWDKALPNTGSAYSLKRLEAHHAKKNEAVTNA